MVFGDEREEFVEVGLLRRGESGSESAIVLAGDLAQFGHEVVSLGGQVQRVEPPVGLIAFTRDVPAGLEFVDEGHHSAGQQLQSCAEFLLTHAGFAVDESEDARQRRGQIQGREQLGKQRCSAMSQLGQEECAAIAGGSGG